MARRAAMIKHRPKTHRVTKTETQLVNEKYMGAEPTVADNMHIGNCLNWYSFMCTTDDARGYLRDYFKNIGKPELAKKISHLSDGDVPLTAAWIARLVSRGYTPPGTTMAFFSSRIARMWDNVKEVQKENSEVPKLTIQERMREKAHELGGEVEGLIDDHLGKGTDFSFYEWLQANAVPVAYVSYFKEKLAPVLGELIEAYEGKDPQLKEGYSHLPKKVLKEYVLFYNRMMEDLDRYADVTKKVRKPRKPRTISVEKKLKTFKFQKEDQALKIASINPEKIIGAQELWLYNTKYKTLTYLKAQDRGGLQVKGTSILCYDEVASKTKGTGRRSEDVVKRCLEGGKIVLRKLMEELKTDKALAVRSNENTILLRVM